MRTGSGGAWKFRRARRGARALAVAVPMAALAAGCGEIRHVRQAPESAPIVQGPAVSANRTPLDEVFACYQADLTSGRRERPVSISVGEVRDFTGRASINEGNAVTQGASMMVMSAIGKLRPAVRLHERFDPRVGELELIYSDRRQLGDGRFYVIPNGRQRQEVPWVPYMGGTILRSDYFIVGGVTELNYSVQSGGVEFGINNVGGRARSFTLNIAIDLRIVDTRSLVVHHTVSLQKQVVGYEVGLGIFRFFNDRLFDVNAGARNLEPIQLAVRTTLELGVIELVEAVTRVSAGRCLSLGVEGGAVSRAYDSRQWSGPLNTEPPPAVPEATPAPPPPPPRVQSRGPAGARPTSGAAQPLPSSQVSEPPSGRSGADRAGATRLFMGIGNVPDVPGVPTTGVIETVPQVNGRAGQAPPHDAPPGPRSGLPQAPAALPPVSDASGAPVDRSDGNVQGSAPPRQIF